MTVILDQHVRGRNQPFEHVARRLLLEIEDDAALIAVHHHEGRRLAGDVGGQHAAGVVAAAGPFDLDDVRAHVGEHAPARRTGHDVRKIEDAHADQRTLFRAHRPSSSAAGSGAR